MRTNNTFILYSGNWSIHCHNDVHYDAGLKAVYHVGTCGHTGTQFYQTTGVVRKYYIGAVERKWNFSPKTIHPLTMDNYSDPNQ